jgi:hypothetical protein
MHQSEPRGADIIDNISLTGHQNKSVLAAVNSSFNNDSQFHSVKLYT